MATANVCKPAKLVLPWEARPDLRQGLARVRAAVALARREHITAGKQFLAPPYTDDDCLALQDGTGLWCRPRKDAEGRDLPGAWEIVRDGLRDFAPQTYPCDC